MEDLHTRWQHRWITPKAKSQKSGIHGLGVFAVQPIKKGEDVGVLGGIVIPVSEIAEYWKKMGHVGIQIDDNFFICPTTREELEKTGVLNHSCNPNCGFGNSIKLLAIKDINVGEELVFDYAFCESFIEQFDCNCGSTNCRKIIKPTDWKLTELQNKYPEYFSPYLKRKFMR